MLCYCIVLYYQRFGNLPIIVDQAFQSINRVTKFYPVSTDGQAHLKMERYFPVTETVDHNKIEYIFPTTKIKKKIKFLGQFKPPTACCSPGFSLPNVTL